MEQDGRPHRARALAGSLALLALFGCQEPPLRPAEPAYGVRFDRERMADLPQIDAADWLAAWPVWLASCHALQAPSRPQRQSWQAVCAAAQNAQPHSGEQVRDFFAAHMDSYRVTALVTDPAPHELASGLMTGYFEPVLEGSRERSAAFSVPIFRAPAPATNQTRAQLRNSGALQGAELLWLANPIDAFFLEVQGSGRVHLPDGSWLRVAYAASNGQAYHSIGRWLIEQGEIAAGQASAQAIRLWAQAHPQRVAELLDQDPRVVFFQELASRDAGASPIGSLGVALTPGLSVAVDPHYLPLGAPLVVDTRTPISAAPLRRIVLAQDTGGAIQGPLRLDWFWGSGPDAELIAGHQNAPGSVHLLVPRGIAPQTLL